MEDARFCQEQYEAYRHIYETASYEYTRAENEIIDIRNRRNQLDSEINDLRAQKRNYEDNLRIANRVSGMDSTVSSKATKSKNDLNEASGRVSRMGSSTSVSNANLNSTFAETTQGVQTKINTAFSKIEIMKTRFRSRIDEIQRDIDTKRRERSNGVTRECQLNNSIYECDRAMRNAQVQMAYYRGRF